MRLSLRRLTSRWKLKLAALGLAILLWVVVSAEQPATQWLPVRVDPVVRDPEFVLAGDPEPRIVRVRFEGAGRELWELALERPVLVLPLREVGNARTFALDPSMVQLPQGVRAKVIDVRPSVVRIELQRLAVRSVPVRPRFGARSQQQYVVGDTPAVFPAEVRLTGPEEALAQVESVPTRAFEIVPGDSSTFSQRVFLDTTGLHGITLSAQEVRVRGRVDRRVDRVFAVVPVTAPEELLVSPAQVRVTVSGPDHLVRAIAPPSLRARVRRDSLPATVPSGGMQAPLVVEGLPPGVTARAVPGRVQVMPPPGHAPLPAAAPDSGPARPR